jgi:hypothetical protein
LGLPPLNFAVGLLCILVLGIEELIHGKNHVSGVGPEFLLVELR